MGLEAGCKNVLHADIWHTESPHPGSTEYGFYPSAKQNKTNRIPKPHWGILVWFPGLEISRSLFQTFSYSPVSLGWICVKDYHMNLCVHTENLFLCVMRAYIACFGSAVGAMTLLENAMCCLGHCICKSVACAKQGASLWFKIPYLNHSNCFQQA